MTGSSHRQFRSQHLILIQLWRNVTVFWTCTPGTSGTSRRRRMKSMNWAPTRRPSLCPNVRSAASHMRTRNGMKSTTCRSFRLLMSRGTQTDPEGRADFADNEYIAELISWEHPHLAASSVAPFTEAENMTMLQLPQKECKLVQFLPHS